MTHNITKWTILGLVFIGVFLTGGIFWAKQATSSTVKPCCASLVETQAEETDHLDRLIEAYPQHLAGREGSTLIWHGGFRMAFSDGKEYSTRRLSIGCISSV